MNESYPLYQEAPSDLRKIPEMITIKELANRTNFTEYGIRKLCAEGVIPTVKVGNKALINYDMFIDYLNGKR